MLAARLRHIVVLAACAAGALAIFSPAGQAALPTAPSALPQLWAVVVDRPTLDGLKPRVLKRMRARDVALVAAPGLGLAGQARLETLARSWKLRAFRPLDGSAPPGACVAVERARPGSRCAARARGLRAARRISRARAADLVVAPARGARAMRRLDNAAATRVLAVVRRGRRPAMAAASGSPGLDLAVVLDGPRRGRALRGFLKRLGRYGAADRRPPKAPRKLALRRPAAGQLGLAWRASRGAVRFGVYRDSRHVKSSGRKRANLKRVSCATHILEVDAVDRAGNRSGKRWVTGAPPGCPESGAPRPVLPPDPYADVGAQPMPEPGPGPPPGFAHLWLDTDGGSCSRSATPVRYNDGAACGSAEQAYAVANATSESTTIVVKGGSYGKFLIMGKRSSPNWIVFAAAPGEQPVFGDGYIALGDGDVGSRAVDYVALRNLSTAPLGPAAANPGNLGGVYVAPYSTNIRLEGLRAGNFLVQAAQNVSVIGGDYGPCRASDGAQQCEINKVDHYPGAPQPRNILIDGASFHDYDLGPSCFTVSEGGTSAGDPDCHWRPMYLNGVHNLTLRNTRFVESFIGPWTTISGSEAASVGNHSILIENNVFGTGVNYGNPSHYANRGYGRWESFDFAWCENASPAIRAYDRIVYRFNSASRAVGPFILFSESGCAGSIGSVTVYGNIGFRNNCDSLVSYRYNVWSNAGTCDGTDRNANAGGALPFYASDVHAPGPDAFRLARPGPADGLVPSVAGCPVQDRFGNYRGAGGVCDAGAHER